MKKLFYFLLLTCTIACEEQKQQPSTLIETNATAINLNNYLTALTKLKKFNGVLFAVSNDSLLIHKAFNLSNQTDSSIFVTPQSQFDIHSVSKLMVNYLFTKLDVEKQLSKYQTIDTFYPNFPNGDKITIDMLLQHSSGLPRKLIGFKGNELDLTTKEIIELTQQQLLLFEPGSDKQYSNIGYEILHDILANHYKKPFAQCIMDEIFKPLNMNNSGAHFYIKEERLKNLARNHVLKDSILVAIPNVLEDEFKTSRIFSTAEDLNQFLTHIKQEPYVTMLKNDDGIIAKNGGSDGIRTQVYTNINQNFNFVFLANYDEIPFQKTIQDLIKILNHQSVEIPKELNRKAIPVDIDTLKKYVGAYSFADFGNLVLEVAIENNQLVVFQDDEKIATLQAETPTVFFEDPKVPESFEFKLNEQGTYDAWMGWKGISLEGKRR